MFAAREEAHPNIEVLTFTPKSASAQAWQTGRRGMRGMGQRSATMGETSPPSPSCWSPIVALLRRRAHVWVATAGSDYLCLYLLKDLRHHTNSLSDSAPLVTLLVESGAEVEEVNRQLITLADLSTSAATTDLTP